MDTNPAELKDTKFTDSRGTLSMLSVKSVPAFVSIRGCTDFRARRGHPDSAMACPIGGGVVALRPLRPSRAGGPSHYRPLANKACAPLCAARRLAARAVPPRRWHVPACRRQLFALFTRDGTQGSACGPEHDRPRRSRAAATAP